MNDNLLRRQAFKLKGRLYTFTVLQLLTADKTLFGEHLDEIIAKAPKLFHNTPVVLDCSALEEGNMDLEDFFQCMRSHSMLPVAIQGASPFLMAFAEAKGIAVLHASSTHDKPIIEQRELESSTTDTFTSKIQAAPVRSGQQVVSKGGDLIITASVSHGAELFSDGNIHVYGALRGRALAGISGDRTARIFCQSLEAELISIAGFYRLSDAIEPQSSPCQIYLQEDHICIEPLGMSYANATP